MRALVIVVSVTAWTSCATDPDDGEYRIAADEATVSAIPRGSTWRYWDRGGDLGTAWRGAFDDTTWATGAGPLGYGEPYLTTTVGYGPSATSKYITTYFRHTFTVNDPDAVTALTGEVMYDDGFVVYINGTRIGSEAMPSGTTTASTLSTGHEAGNAYQTYDWTPQLPWLVAGTNVIAIEVHQQAASSSDLVFDLSLSMATEAAQVELEHIQRNDDWVYWDTGQDLGTAWRLSNHWDPGAQAGFGVFGYGEGYIDTPISYGPSATNRNITTYFRNSVYLTNPGAVTSMIAELMYDDGAVVYLNGTEVLRASMPSGTISYTTLSTGHEAGDRYLTYDLTAMRGLLRYGTNDIAVEVHQVSPSSSDLVFDMALLLYADAPPPPDDEEDIARGSVWRFWDRATAPDPYDQWAEPDWNDATWGSGAGPLGYGESYVETTTSYGADAAAKPATQYFRRWFTVDAPSIETTLRAEVLYDDGIVIHLNGHDVVDRAMPSGYIGHDTLSTGHETGAYEAIDLGEFSDLLVPGANLIAVEVHQQSRSSSDLVFDLALEVDTPPVCEISGCGPASPPPPGAGLFDVWVGPTSVWTVGENGAVGRRDPSGAWCWCAPAADTTFTGVWGTAEHDVWMIGDAGRVVHYVGTSAETVDIGTTHTLRDIWGTGPDDIWIIGAQGTIRHFDGTAWTAHDLPSDQSMRAVWAASTTDVWVTSTELAPYPDPEQSEYDGVRAIIWRWVPSTGTWTREHENTMYYGDADYAAIHGTSASDVWAVGLDHPAGAACSYSGAVHYDGTSWSGVSFPDEENGCRQFDDVAAGAPGGTWIVSGSDGGAIRYTGGAWVEAEEPLTRDLFAIDHRGDRMFAVGSPWGGQKILRWEGERWVSER